MTAKMGGQRKPSGLAVTVDRVRVINMGGSWDDVNPALTALSTGLSLSFELGQKIRDAVRANL